MRGTAFLIGILVTCGAVHSRDAAACAAPRYYPGDLQVLSDDSLAILQNDKGKVTWYESQPPYDVRGEVRVLDADHDSILASSQDAILLGWSDSAGSISTRTNQWDVPLEIARLGNLAAEFTGDSRLVIAGIDGEAPNQQIKLFELAIEPEAAPVLLAQGDATLCAQPATKGLALRVQSDGDIVLLCGMRPVAIDNEALVVGDEIPGVPGYYRGPVMVLPDDDEVVVLAMASNDASEESGELESWIVRAELISNSWQVWLIADPLPDRYSAGGIAAIGPDRMLRWNFTSNVVFDRDNDGEFREAARFEMGDGLDGRHLAASGRQIIAGGITFAVATEDPVNTWTVEEREAIGTVVHNSGCSVAGPEHRLSGLAAFALLMVLRRKRDASIVGA